jgi:acid phosphatase (class A)
MSAPTNFTDEMWDPYYRRNVYMHELLATDWRDAITLDAWDAGEVAAEIKALLVLKTTEREANLPDILKQVKAPFEYFLDAIGVPTGTTATGANPRIWELMYLGDSLGSLIGQFYKIRFKRLRPSVLEPAVEPVIAVPGHPSYPSNHSTQAHLVSLFLAEVARPRTEVLMKLAWEIGVNRERAGLHYRSDTMAGKDLAAQVFALLKRGPAFLELLEIARAEYARRP